MQEITENTGSENQSQLTGNPSLELGTIFTEDNYALYYHWAIENGYTIKELEESEGKRCFQIIMPQTEITYIQQRLAEYPPIGDQLDMIYWDKVNGTNLWQEMISEIKMKYPKE